ncbi:hypothetical protein BASA50_011403 [Batrachochytrium salamandrivorans]|uniref:GLTSCR protein conserved domain-containing protein n=1 Tax=Batrachochytrium salamandrivorans TaxID=1357716 RepID=A0ABQ8EVV7_9FUNG|nr:hypothetical protein BASA50_011403 [Batrachochytrium salamandrivorans]KAH9271637.1 hypothetical protein BASA83_006249 [Batrachochytrium salamandrivorans]
MSPSNHDLTDPPPPVRTADELAKAQLTVQRIQAALAASQQMVLAPDLSAFTGISDILSRLLPYHILQHPSLDVEVEPPGDSTQLVNKARELLDKYDDWERREELDMARFYS